MQLSVNRVTQSNCGFEVGFCTEALATDNGRRTISACAAVWEWQVQEERLTCTLMGRYLGQFLKEAIQAVGSNR
ncbi:hypothetical protein ATO1_08440 [Phaeobacter sp. 22II1-1F12B]|nr:hypothetical protein ATO1_08440 [Phaeobacter sp. 22II1-1F12B]